MEKFGLTRSIMNVKNVKKKNEITKENLKKHAVSKNKMKKLNLRKPEEQMNYFLHAIS